MLTRAFYKYPYVTLSPGFAHVHDMVGRLWGASRQYGPGPGNFHYSLASVCAVGDKVDKPFRVGDRI